MQYFYIKQDDKISVVRAELANDGTHISLAYMDDDFSQGSNWIAMEPTRLEKGVPAFDPDLKAPIVLVSNDCKLYKIAFRVIIGKQFPQHAMVWHESEWVRSDIPASKFGAHSDQYWKIDAMTQVRLSQLQDTVQTLQEISSDTHNVMERVGVGSEIESKSNQENDYREDRVEVAFDEPLPPLSKQQSDIAASIVTPDLEELKISSVSKEDYVRALQAAIRGDVPAGFADGWTVKTLANARALRESFDPKKIEKIPIHVFYQENSVEANSVTVNDIYLYILTSLANELKRYQPDATVVIKPLPAKYHVKLGQSPDRDQTSYKAPASLPATAHAHLVLLHRIINEGYEVLSLTERREIRSLGKAIIANDHGKADCGDILTELEGILRAENLNPEASIEMLRATLKIYIFDMPGFTDMVRQRKIDTNYICQNIHTVDELHSYFLLMPSADRDYAIKMLEAVAMIVCSYVEEPKDVLEMADRMPSRDYIIELLQIVQPKLDAKGHSKASVLLLLLGHFEGWHESLLHYYRPSFAEIIPNIYAYEALMEKLIEPRSRSKVFAFLMKDARWKSMVVDPVSLKIAISPISEREQVLFLSQFTKEKLKSFFKTEAAFSLVYASLASSAQKKLLELVGGLTAFVVPLVTKDSHFANLVSNLDRAQSHAIALNIIEKRFSIDEKTTKDAIKRYEKFAGSTAATNLVELKSAIKRVFENYLVPKGGNFGRLWHCNRHHQPLAERFLDKLDKVADVVELQFFIASYYLKANKEERLFTGSFGRRLRYAAILSEAYSKIHPHEFEIKPQQSRMSRGR